MTLSLRLSLALSSRSIGYPRRSPSSRRHGTLQRLAPVSARRGNREGNGPQGLDPALEAAVPAEQRPVNELAQLKEAPLCGWATLPLPEYIGRLAVVFGGSCLLIGGPIAAQTFKPVEEPLAFAAAAGLGGVFVVGLASLRMWLGWEFVGKRLMTATLEYEESGWYDGQLFVKPPEVLMRDRLLGIYQVRPIVRRLVRTLQAAGVGLAGGILALTLLSQDQPVGLLDATGRRVPAQVTPYGIIFSDKVKDFSELAFDDEAAEAEAAAQGGVPGYCGDRYYRAAAGGYYCRKFDVR